MKTFGTIRFRLTAWFVAIMAVIATSIGLVSWIAIHESLQVTVDRGLRRDMDVFTTSVQIHVNVGNTIPEAIDATIRLGLRDTPVRVFDASSAVVYETASLKGRLPVTPTATTDAALTFHTLRTDDGTWRLAAGRLTIQGRPFVAELVQPLTVGERTLVRFGRILLITIPLTLVIAGLGGYWLSGRALAPVDRITASARDIGATNLSARLTVPTADDELRGLSTTLNEMLARIEQSVAQLRQFTADASHELRAPLALIQTAAEFSLRRERSAAELTDALQKILRESRRTTTLVNDLLVLARADSGAETVHRDTVDLATLCREAVDQGVALARDKGVAITTDLSVASLSVTADEGGLRRVLLILVDNAVKYTPADGGVTVYLGTDAGMALVRVTNTGTGIAPEDLPHVFDRFWRADKVRSRAAGGTGLGLSIARSIVESHGGTITAESEPGLCTSFDVRLPQVGQ